MVGSDDELAGVLVEENVDLSVNIRFLLDRQAVHEAKLVRFLAAPVFLERVFRQEQANLFLAFRAGLVLFLLVAFLNHFDVSWDHLSEETVPDRLVEHVGKRLLVSPALHQVQLVVSVGVEPEDVAAWFEQHEVELVREASLSDSQDHGLLPHFLILFLSERLIDSLLLA